MVPFENFWIFPFVPLILQGVYYLQTPPPSDARAIFLQKIYYVMTRVLYVGKHNGLGAQTEKILMFLDQKQDLLPKSDQILDFLRFLSELFSITYLCFC